MCSVDWGIVKDILVALIGAGIPSVVAWCVFIGWSKQKEKEVIALEAKNTLINLEKLAIIQNDILFWSRLNSGNVDEKAFQEFKQVKDSLDNSILLLNHAIKDQEFNTYLKEILQLVNNFEKTLKGYNSSILDLREIAVFSLENYDHFKKELLEYALYKKKINYNFKENRD